MKSLKEIVEEVKELAEEAGEVVIEMFATVINKLTSTNKKVSSIPRHRWKVYINNLGRRKKRAYPRKKVFSVVYYATLDKSYFGLVHDVSEGGVFIRPGEPLSPKTDVTLAFTMPKSNIPIETKGEVMWTGQGGMGLRFKELDELTKDKIKSALS